MGAYSSGIEAEADEGVSEGASLKESGDEWEDLPDFPDICLSPQSDDEIAASILAATEENSKANNTIS